MTVPPPPCPLSPPPRPQHRTLGWSTRGLPHFTKRDDNPFAGKIRDLPVSSWSGGVWRLNRVLKSSVCLLSVTNNHLIVDEEINATLALA